MLESEIPRLAPFSQASISRAIKDIGFSRKRAKPYNPNKDKIEV